MSSERAEASGAAARRGLRALLRSRHLWVPWDGRASRGDKVLMGAFVAVVAVGLLLRPVTPFLIASHPVLLEFLTGDPTAIGAAAAFARIGDAPLWLVVVAGTVGAVKFDWLMWWAGRRWGQGIIRMVTTSRRSTALARRVEGADPRIVSVAVTLAMLPGIPTAVVYALAGMSGMRLSVFLLLDFIGALTMTGLVAGLGFGLGQHAVDVVLTIDRYASAVSLTLIGLAITVPLARQLLRAARRRHTLKANGGRTS